MKRSALFGLVATAFMASGCAAVATQPLTGLWYSDLKFDGPVTASTAATKEGRACGTSILGLVATGDASVTAAKAAGGISEVSVVDHTSKGILGFFAEYCTVVKGR